MDWEDIRKEYESTDITLKALAEKHSIKLGTLKSRKSRDGWSRDPTKKGATKNKKDATPPKRMQPQKEPKFVFENNDLTENQKRFCLEYIKYFNATKAYQKAYSCAYSTAMVNGHGLLRNTKILSEIERLKAEQQQNLFLDGRAVLQKYIDIAFADITDFVEFGQKEIEAIGAFGPIKDENGDQVMIEVNYVDFKSSDEIDGTLISEVKKGKDGVSVKLADKMKALDFLAKYTDLLSDGDRKKLQEEKLKVDIAKTKAEVDKIAAGDDDKPIEILIKRKT
jgi:phage terminase small subunit